MIYLCMIFNFYRIVKESSTNFFFQPSLRFQRCHRNFKNNALIRFEKFYRVYPVGKRYQGVCLYGEWSKKYWLILLDDSFSDGISSTKILYLVYASTLIQFDEFLWRKKFHLPGRTVPCSCKHLENSFSIDVRRRPNTVCKISEISLSQCPMPQYKPS